MAHQHPNWVPNTFNADLLTEPVEVVTNGHHLYRPGGLFFGKWFFFVAFLLPVLLGLALPASVGWMFLNFSISMMPYPLILMALHGAFQATDPKLRKAVLFAIPALMVFSPMLFDNGILYVVDFLSSFTALALVFGAFYLIRRFYPERLPDSHPRQIARQIVMLVAATLLLQVPFGALMLSWLGSDLLSGGWGAGGLSGSVVGPGGELLGVTATTADVGLGGALSYVAIGVLALVSFYLFCRMFQQLFKYHYERLPRLLGKASLSEIDCKDFELLHLAPQATDQLPTELPSVTTVIENAEQFIEDFVEEHRRREQLRLSLQNFLANYQPFDGAFEEPALPTDERPPATRNPLNGG